MFSILKSGSGSAKGSSDSAGVGGVSSTTLLSSGVFGELEPSTLLSVPKELEVAFSFSLEVPKGSEVQD